jgi:hypothetical protein
VDTTVNQNKKALLLGLFSVAVVTLVYFNVTTSYKDIPLSDMENRGIETPLKLWLNGYLGVFFGFKSHSNIVWLLPLLLVFAWNKIKHINALKYFMAFYIILLLLIAIKGYINGRYQFTLVPLSIIAIVLLINKIFDDVKNQQKLVYFFVVLSLFNTIYFTSIDYWPKYKNRFYDLFNDRKQDKSEDLKLNYITFINTEIPENEWVLVNNLPEFFYYTNHKGLFCWTGKNEVYTTKEKKVLVKDNYNDEDLKQFIVNELNCKYFFTTIQFNNYHPEFSEFLSRQAELVFTDNNKYLIYRFKT